MMLAKAHDNRADGNGTVGGKDNRLLALSLLAAVTGIAAGLAAYLLIALIGFISNLIFFQRIGFQIPNLRYHTLGPLVVVMPIIGGLIIGLIAKYVSPEIHGHGVPEAIEAVLTNRSRISPRIALLKQVSTAIVIGTGGPVGAEGPIISTGSSVGSLVGQMFRLTAAERKVLLSCGAAAGMAAAFNTPIAAVILAIELLLFEFKTRSFIPLVIASTLATTVHFGLTGRGPMFDVGQMDFGVPAYLPHYVALGLICGFFAVGYSGALYWVEDQFERLPLDPMWWPVLAGLVIGVIGYFAPYVLGVGYDNITSILNNEFAPSVLIVIVLVKSLALFLALGSGMPGGLLTPTFMIGAALGALFALAVNAVVPGANLSPGACALAAMAAVFGAASRATFTFIIFAFELTRDYTAVLPLMLVCVVADLVTTRFMRNSMQTEKLVRRGLRVQQDYEADIMHRITVAEVMDSDPPRLPAKMPLAELADRIARDDPQLGRRNGLPIVDEDGHLVGIITRSDVLRAMERPDRASLSILLAGTSNPRVTYPDEPMNDAIDKMLRYDVGRLPVVRRDRPQELVGYLGRTGILEARLRRMREENEREPGWLQRDR